MIQNKFIKNLYHTLSSLTPVVIIDFALLWGFYRSLSFENNYGIWLLIFAVLLLVGFFTFGFYFIFQTVIINEHGIQINLLSHRIRFVPWSEVEGICLTNRNRNPVYLLTIKNGANLLLDGRKKIKKALVHYSSFLIE